MADARLRALQRQAALGEPQARVLLLRARLRAGELDWEGVELAAYLGDAEARSLSGQQPPAGASLREWVKGLPTLEATSRAAIAAARAALGCWVSFSPEDARPTLGIAAAEAWVRCPCREHALEAGTSVRDCQAASFLAAAVAADKAYGPERDRAWAAEAAANAASEAAACAANTAWWAPEQAALQASYALNDVRAVQDAIRSELLPWALGRADPLALMTVG